MVHENEKIRVLCPGYYERGANSAWKRLFAGASVIVPRPIVGGGHGTLRGKRSERSGMTKPVFRYHHLLFSLMIIGRDSTSFRIL